MSIKRTILQTLPIPALPGYESRLVLLEFPPGYAVPPHTHPVAGACYVVEGSVVSRYEGQDEDEVFGEGETFIDRADVMHWTARNASAEKVLKVLVSYVVEVGVMTTVIA